MLTNTNADKVFDKLMVEGETYVHYFYVMKMASTFQCLAFGLGALGLNKHYLVGFTNKRILLIELSPATGNVTENITHLDLDKVEKVSVKRGILKSNITLKLKEDKGILEMKLNSFTVGLSNHKKGLVELEKLYG
ncbi:MULTISPECIES: PH domain-containing protein [unclassified Bacillus (in: firmicutes)]|uniref:PH domain-containing protein n=1 Tax=unclassified Bacillus (in: firmicutes) TaxID=185979 RepID=UPI0008E4F860|nr:MULTISPECIES: PH domain-containing protein [unclassified Bacillus (in: firmicutes)]SFJ73843.1 PH domain-containing protein [Bacillus sp. 71mf]SFS69259.1 PH domain-containing protein [Bacillus sp. 103mf]